MPSNQLECIFDALPDSVIVCDREGKISRINASALKLFEVASEANCRGTLYQQFLHLLVECPSTISFRSHFKELEG